MKEELLKKLPEEKEIYYWKKDLNVPTSDYAYGHMRGYGIALKEVKEIIEKI